MTPQFTNILPIHTTSRRLGPTRMMAAAASTLVLFFAAAHHTAAQTPTLIVVRGMPSHAKIDENFLPQQPLTKADIGQIKIGGKVVPVTAVDPLLGGPHGLQLMVLLDSWQMLGSGPGQFDSIKKFFHDMPPNVEIGVGWLLQGRVVVTQPFTTDRDLAGKALVAKTREEAANPKNDNGNPFQCLGYLASHWPTPDPGKLRAVLMFNDGAIRSNGQPQGKDSINPDVLSAAAKLEIASITPYPFFWQDPIIADPNRSTGTAVDAADNFGQMDARAGGAGLYEGMFAPGSLDQLLNRLYSTLKSESVLTVDDPNKPGSEKTLDMKSTRDDIKLFGPDQVVSGNTLGK
ncbi:MAG TPA: hypothetical protein VMQ60_03855 [Acidobacteriaceae bacterium]|nr:hypothetical protein [Acidobacteriaceae bacterium]